MGNAPIGIFDSGLGGLTVARSVIDKLPRESIVYLGDTRHTPYGDKSLEDVRSLTLKALDELVERGIKMLVIACNTGSAAALPQARDRYDIPVVEVVQPAARRAGALTRNGHVGVLATAATVRSGAYERAFSAFPGGSLTQQACPQFVPFVERGETTGGRILQIAREYLAPVQAADVDTVILGCTHYPLLTGVLSYVLGEGVNLVSSSEASADEVYHVLTNREMLRTELDAPSYEFYATGQSESFEPLARRFLGPVVSHVKHLEVRE